LEPWTIKKLSTYTNVIVSRLYQLDYESMDIDLDIRSNFK